jgi:hypothetical protein
MHVGGGGWYDGNDKTEETEKIYEILRAMNSTSLLIWAGLCQIYKTILDRHTGITVPRKYAFEYREQMFPQKILTFHSWENIF